MHNQPERPLERTDAGTRAPAGPAVPDLTPGTAARIAAAVSSSRADALLDELLAVLDGL